MAQAWGCSSSARPPCFERPGFLFLVASSFRLCISHLDKRPGPIHGRAFGIQRHGHSYHRRFWVQSWPDWSPICPSFPWLFGIPWLILSKERNFLHYSHIFLGFKYGITLHSLYRKYVWDEIIVFYINFILTATLKLQLFLLTLHYFQNSRSNLILRYITLWLH